MLITLKVSQVWRGTEWARHASLKRASDNITPVLVLLQRSPLAYIVQINSK